MLSTVVSQNTYRRSDERMANRANITFGQQQTVNLGQAPYFHVTPFSSVVQLPVRETLQANPSATDTPEQKKRKERLTLVGPGFLLAGGLVLLTKSLPAGIRQKVLGPLFRTVSKNAHSPEAINEVLSSVGTKLIGVGGLFVSANGISGGIVSGQPNMIVGNLIQFAPAIIMLFAKNNLVKNIATSFLMATGAMFTMGFANEIRNKDPHTAPSQIRRYDMTRFKAILHDDNQMSGAERLGGLFSEFGRMLRFSVDDHIIAAKRALHPDKKKPKQAFSEWFTEPAASKSELAALFFYLGALPTLFAKLRPNIAENKILMGLKFMGMLLANAPVFAIALHRDDLRGKAPLLGVPMAVAGMALPKNDFFIGLGNTGESITNLFFSDVAVNGLKTNNKDEHKNPHSNLSADSQVNPFNTTQLTKRLALT